MKKKWVAIGVGVLALLLIVTLSIRGSRPKGEKVYVEPVTRKDVEAVVSAPGEVDPRIKVNVSSRVIAKIEKLHFAEGDEVKRGQPLVDLERAAYAAQRERVAAELANRRIDVQRAQLQLRNSEAQFQRAQNLRAQGIQAEELFDRAKLELDTARANLAATQEGVRQAQALLSQANEDLGYTRILAPMDGRVVQLNLREGEVVVTGTTNVPGSVIAVIADLSGILVQGEVSETEIVKVRLGQPVKIKVDASPDKDYRGEVVEIGSSATMRAGSQTGVRYFKVKASIANPDDDLRPGMTAQIDIVTEARQNVIAVPVQCVVEKTARSIGLTKKKEQNEERKKYVLIERGGKAEAVEVTTGVGDATHIEIVSGLKGDEKVVTGPFRTLRSLKHGDPLVPEQEPTGTDRKGKEEEEERK